ncbi:hypothetical protein GF336_03160 [Candidatus Woesearchaeota archaeon]|nr:hypothetical protein [Candidatus Woesearchaeota archaeon]
MKYENIPKLGKYDPICLTYSKKSRMHIPNMDETKELFFYMAGSKEHLDVCSINVKDKESRKEGINPFKISLEDIVKIEKLKE